MVKLSIIIPHFNEPKLLKRLLKSIPIRNDIEVLVIDDNSTKYLEELSEIINSHKEFNRKFFTNTNSNKGAGSCRNIGLEKAQGEWILFSDSDDYFAPNFYDVILKYFESDNSIVYFSPYSTEMGSKKPSDRHLFFEAIVKKYIGEPSFENELPLRYKYVVPWSKMYKKEFLERYNIRFSETIVSNDVIFSTKTGIYANRITASNEVIYIATKRKGSLTTTISEEYFDIRVKTFVEYNKLLKENLNIKDYNKVRVGGVKYLHYSIKNNFGLKKTLEIVKIMRKANIAIIDTRLFNPLFIIRVLKRNLK